MSIALRATLSNALSPGEAAATAAAEEEEGDKLGSVGVSTAAGGFVEEGVELEARVFIGGRQPSPPPTTTTLLPPPLPPPPPPTPPPPPPPLPPCRLPLAVPSMISYCVIGFLAPHWAAAVASGFR